MALNEQKNKRGKRLLFLNSSELNHYYHKAKKRQKRVKLERAKDFFFQEESVHRIFFSNKTHPDCKILACHAKKVFSLDLKRILF